VRFAWPNTSLLENNSLKLGGDPEIFGEGPFLVDPGGFAAEAGLASHVGKFRARVFVAGFGPDGFSSDQIEGSTGRGDGNRLVDTGLEMHFDAAGGFIENGDVLELGNVEIGANFAIETSEDIEIEGSGDADGVIVGSDERGDGLHKIRAEEERIAGAKSFANAGKKIDASRAIEIADGAAEEKDEEVLICFAACDDFLKTLKIFAFKTYDMDALNVAEFALTHGQGIAGDFDGMVTRLALAAAKRFEKHAGLFAGATAEFRDKDGRRQFGNDFVGILSKETAFGAGDTIFGKMADDFEESGAYGIVQIF